MKNKFIIEMQSRGYLHQCTDLGKLEEICNKKSISAQPYPNFNPKFLIVTDYDYPVSFNGKMKFKLKLKTGIEADDIKNIVINDEKTIKTLNGRKIKKVIVVPKKIINIVC